MRRPEASIRLRLLIWLLVPLVTIGVIGGCATYWLSWVPARNAYDLALANAAWQLAIRQRDWRQGLVIDVPIQMELGLRSSDRFDQIFFAIHDRNGIWLAGDRGLPAAPIPHDLDKPVFYDGDYGGLPVRLVSLPTLSAGELVIVTVAETVNKRQVSQRRILWTVLTWGTALSFIIATLSWLATSQGLAPLDRVKEAVARRSLRDLRPIEDAQVPTEIRPLTDAINGLLARIDEAASAQQTFLADVAHQLRTPLAGLLTQLAVAQQHTASDELRKSIALMQNTADRTVRLANQLLMLARTEHSGFRSERLQALDLADVIRQCAEGWMRMADQKHIDLRFELEPAPVLGNRFLLRELLDNLLANAVQYTPVGGDVAVGCGLRQQQPFAFIEDSGPGIAEEQRPHVFNRFYRVPGTSADGSGLGLTIAREIAQEHGARIEIVTPSGGAGARFEVLFPPPRHAGPRA